MKGYLRLTILLAMSVALTSCGEVINTTDTVTSTIEQVDNTIKSHEFAYLWDGTIPKHHQADLDNCVLESEGYNISLWYCFLSDVNDDKDSEVNIINESSAYTIRYTHDGEYTFEIFCKSIDHESGEYTYSQHGITTDTVNKIISDGTSTYYVGGYPLITLVDNSTKENYVPFSCGIYKTNSDSTVSYPFNKMFTSYNDFSAYYEQYSDELGLDEVNTAMTAYDEDGSFNNHVVFLYADMDGSESVEYKVVNVIHDDNKLKICLQKSIPLEKSSNVGKWQVVVEVPSEYLDEISPDDIQWQIMYDYELASE